MVIKAKVPQIMASGKLRTVTPGVMEIKPKIAGVPRVWTPGAINRRFGPSSVAWGKK